MLGLEAPLGGHPGRPRRRRDRKERPTWPWDDWPGKVALLTAAAARLAARRRGALPARARASSRPTSMSPGSRPRRRQAQTRRPPARPRRSRRWRPRSGRSSILFKPAPASSITRNRPPPPRTADWDFSVRSQRQVDAPDDPRLSAGHAGEGQGLDRQRGLWQASSVRGIPSRYVYGSLEGRGDRPHQVGRLRASSARACAAALPSAPARSRSPSLDGRIETLEQVERRAARDRVTPGVHRPPADGPAQQAKTGEIAAIASLPRLRRERLRHRPRSLPSRWRICNVRVVSGPAVKASKHQ